MKALFPLGRVVATPGALELLRQENTQYIELLQRHQSGDWGKVPPEDAAENTYAVDRRLRILSSYHLKTGTIWIITEADRSSTTLLLPSEY